ncbi:DUF262 domain-containing protein [Clostridium butyricum]|uniref:DUF262 domain-containing protein n=1 Tax=Clostridium butyricum TaxID=1492 RepID=UPI002910F5E8|nr:DUF262 domain-containing HNH endonuclease family protein [Clostridium butyricum]MDU3594509.1 DUF262 domain-containing HNH endonuclease family protein [Clostridium butyricum]
MDIKPKDFFESDEHSIKSLLTEKNRKYTVPDYQRKYAWTTSEVNQLWLDFLKTVDECFTKDYKEEKSNIEPHFFGAIVLTQTENNICEITDGQQRLTTSIILIKLFYELADNIQDSRAKSGIKNKLVPLFERSEYGDPFESRLCLDDTIDDFFKNYILLPQNNIQRKEYLALHPVSKNSSKQRLVDSCQYLHGKLCDAFPNTLSSDEFEDKLLCFCNTFTRYFMLLKILVYKKETAYMIFETLNKRGKDLSESDMIKNELFKSVSSTNREKIKDLWDKISDCLDMEDLTDYIRFQYSSSKANVTPAKLYEEIKKHINSVDPLLYLTKLVDEVDWFAKITLLDTTNLDTELIALLKAFKSLDITHCYPLLLSIAICYNNNLTTLKKLIKCTLTFCFRYFTIGGSSVANLENEIGNLARVLRHLNSTESDYIVPSKYSKITSVGELIDYMKTLTDDSIFMKKFSEFTTKSNSLAFYIIYNLECSISTGVAPLPHGPSQHIEHIMPKNPSKAKKRLNEWGHIRNNPNYNEYLFRLGNMLILESEINLKVKNKDYSIKQNEYINSGLYYPKYISNTYSVWDFTSIDNHQYQMAQKAVIVWSYS